ncbi:hypothetical protein P3T20_002275 [Paraburkholderia sp. GAS206C]|uniref:hypothetical protein n=1 Tax=unclassified Paraburkholderia TaxID=2615204 RepID=UPI003D1ECF90
MKVTVTTGFNPDVFALATIEQSFGPDDTAWQFLRWNPEYLAAFRDRREKESNPEAFEAIVSHVKVPYPGMIACAQDYACRGRFGIAAWLDPECEQLPALKNDGDSWFFPLRRVEQQDSAHALRGRGLSPHKLDWYPWLTVRETPFGYGPVITPGPNLPRPKGKKKKEYEPRLIHVAFDCSIPIEGQLMAFEALVQKHREYWNERICSTTTPTAIVESIESRDIFRADDFVNRDWARTVTIDALGPIKKQIEQCRLVLDKIYRELDSQYRDLRKKHRDVDEGELFRHFGERFPMPKPPRGYEAAPRSNRYLKALLSIAERMPPDAFKSTNIDAEHPELAQQIAEEIGISREGANPPKWMKVFYEGMRGTHLRRAKHLVNYFYAWLVHAQVSFAKDDENAK